MSGLIEALVTRRPFLFHLTAAENIPRIRRQGRLLSASALFHAAGRPEEIRRRRREHIRLDLDGETLVVRDQAPLHQGNMLLSGGWGFADFVAVLNGYVFFWPGTLGGPIEHGRRHFARYKDEAVSLLRVSTADIIAINPDHPPLVCTYNSGSPRWSRGKPSPRGPTTFTPASASALGPSAVIEVTFATNVALPESTEMARTLEGPWEPLRDAARER